MSNENDILLTNISKYDLWHWKNYIKNNFWYSKNAAMIWAEKLNFHRGLPKSQWNPEVALVFIRINPEVVSGWNKGVVRAMGWNRPNRVSLELLILHFQYHKAN